LVVLVDMKKATFIVFHVSKTKYFVQHLKFIDFLEK